MPATQLQLEAIKSLSLAEKRALLSKLQQKTGTASSLRQGGRLLAFVRMPEENSDFDATLLRHHCDALLPAYMVPQHFIRLARFPVSVSGKVDRDVLANYETTHLETNRTGRSKTENAGQSEPEHASNDIERQLIEIWESVLGMEGVTVDDNFFEVGGDSLQIIRILSRAAKAGIRIKPDEIFSHPTIAGQAQLATVDTAVVAEQNTVTGDMPLLPIQEWFFERIRTDRHWWNQSFLFQLKNELSSAQIERIVKSLLTHHDALRTIFVENKGHWQASIPGMPKELPVQSVDISALDVSAQDERISDHASKINQQLSLEHGPLLRFVLFKTGAQQTDRLLIVAHHLIVDAESWQLIVADFQTAWQQLLRGEDIKLSAKTSSAQLWSRRLHEFSKSTEATKLIVYWRDALSTDGMVLPPDSSLTSPPVPDSNESGLSGAGRESDTLIIRTSLEVQATRELLEDIAQQQTSRMHYILLAALAQALGRWTGSANICLDMEGHGREALFDDVDLARTVGWFTTVFPIQLRAPAASAWSSFPTALRIVKERLQALPYNGLGHGLVKNRLPEIPPSQVLFNYLGQQGEGSGLEEHLVMIDNRCGQSRSARCEKAYGLEVNMFVQSDQLVCDWSFNRLMHSSATIERLAQDFNDLILNRHSLEHGAAESSMTPADFPLAGLNQDELDSIGGMLDDLDDD